MANPFPTPNVYNGQYAPHSFYPAYNASPQTPNSNTPTPFSQTVHHNPAFPVSAANTKRFEANAHVPSPPIPFQLPPNWNPDVLRQLAASSNLQFPVPPPPPPPPLPQLFASSFPPGLHTPTTVTPTHQQQPFAQFQNRRSSPLAPNPISVGHVEPRNLREVPKTQQGRRAEQSLHPELQEHAQIIHNHPVHSLDGSAFTQYSHPDSPLADPAVPLARVSDTTGQLRAHTAEQNASVSRLENDQVHASYQDLLVKAKAAIAQCVPFGATYVFWLENGVKQPVVDKLFAQLNLEHPALPHAASSHFSQMTSVASKPTDVDASHQQPVAETTELTEPIQSELLDPAMERKDRIARLLAAKKGQPLTSAKSSLSASPAPTESIPRQPTEPSSQLKQSAQNSQNTLAIRIGEDGDPTRISTNTTSEVQPATALIGQSEIPTPIREEMRQQGFSIPGLFLTSADSNGLNALPGLENVGTDTVQESVPLSPSKHRSQKRGADPLPAHAMPQAKRQASHTKNSSDTVNVMDTDTFSPTNINNIGDVSSQTSDSKGPSQSNESEKVLESGLPATKSKINQDKLKDRMAALKADLLRKNSRKKDLQDGMPALDAEVQNTRNRLQDQRTLLENVRKNIALKTSELADSREEESRLTIEIQRLEDQLADGENGQKQFSHELNQLTTQIVADEKAATLEKSETYAASNSTNNEKPADSSNMQRQQYTYNRPLNEQPNEKLARSGVTDSYTSEDTHMLVTTTGLPHTRKFDTPEQGATNTGRGAENSPRDPVAREEAEDMSVHSDTGAIDATEAVVVNKSSEQMDLSQNTTPLELQSHDNSDDDRMSIDEGSDNESSGSASMSDSASEDYEPTVDHNPDSPEVTQENEEYEPAEATPYEPTTEPENDEYEPAEQVDIINMDSLPKADIAEQASPESTLNKTVQPDFEPSSAMLSPPEEDDAVASVSPTSQESVDRAPSSEPATEEDAAQQHVKSADIPEPLIMPFTEHEQPAVSHFVPYQSPLSNLKSFRFHPQFNELVKSGYRSLTYSNNIDAKKPLCSTELEGKMCTDIKCIDQHFGSMALSGMQPTTNMG